MAQISRDKIKVKGFKRIWLSIKYSLQGFAYAYKYEQSMILHLIVTIFAVILGIVCHIKTMEWVIIAIVLGVILAVEFINTAIEAAVDLTTLEINPLAKIAKDCGSAASFVLSVMGMIIGLYIFLPYIIAWF